MEVGHAQRYLKSTVLDSKDTYSTGWSFKNGQSSTGCALTKAKRVNVVTQPKHVTVTVVLARINDER